MHIDVTVRNNTVEVTPRNQSVSVAPVNRNIDVTESNLNIEVGTRGIQGPSGASTPTGLYATIIQLQTLSGELYAQLNNISGGAVTFVTDLSIGLETQYIPFPTVLNAIPEGVSCEIENNVDNFIYSYAISSVTISGFDVNFSDALSASGYRLHSTINL